MTISAKLQEDLNTESPNDVYDDHILTSGSLKRNNRLPMVIDSAREEDEAAVTQEAVVINNDVYYPQDGGSLNRESSKKKSETGNDKRSEKEYTTSEKDIHYRDHQYGWHRKTRFHVALLGLAIAVVNCYAQATFCIAIVEMVLPSDFVYQKSQSSQTIIKVMHNNDKDSILAENLNTGSADNSCPIEYQYRDYYDSWRFPQTTTTTTINLTSTLATNQTNSNNIDISNRFDWDASRQGLLLGAFAVGTAPLQVLGGRLAEIYGAKWVLFVGCIGTALTNLTIPILAHFSFALLIVNRVFMGIAQAGMEPGLMCLLAEWMTPAETGFFISMLLFAICIGFFLGSLGSSFLLTLGYGWPITYYVAGGINLLVAIIWMCYASSRPKESRLITADELEFIEHEQCVARKQDKLKLNISTIAVVEKSQHSKGTSNFINNNTSQHQQKILPDQLSSSVVAGTISAKKSILTNQQDEEEKEETNGGQAPWFNILTTRSVWAFIICKISIRWCADVLAIELPTYLANVLHLSIKLNGIVNSVSSALFAIFSFLTGYLVNKILQDQQQQHQQTMTSGSKEATLMGGMRISKTNLRKLMQSFASFGAAISLFLMTRYDCYILFSMSMLLVLSCCLVMGTGGELQIPYDMTSRYPGTLHGMACTLSVSGWLAPPLIGLILGDQPSSRYRWSIVWYMTALINLIGGLVFVLFADASPRDFDRVRQQQTRASDAAADDDDDESMMIVGSKIGYFNVACKSADNSPPSETRQPHKTIATCGMKHDLEKQQENSMGWSSHFDSKPIKVRQLEESFIRPYYLSGAGAIDSVAASVVIFPYRTKEQFRNSSDEQQEEINLHLQKQQQQQQSALWNHSTIAKEREPQVAGGKKEGEEPTSGKRNSSSWSLWPRIRRRRRKFNVETKNELIGSLQNNSSGPLVQQKLREPEAKSNQLSSDVEIMIPADVLPHCRRKSSSKRSSCSVVVGDTNKQLQLETPSSATAAASAVSMTTKTITHL